MESKFNGICTVFAAVILSATIVWHSHVSLEAYVNMADSSMVETTDPAILAALDQGAVPMYAVPLEADRSDSPQNPPMVIRIGPYEYARTIPKFAGPSVTTSLDQFAVPASFQSTGETPAGLSTTDSSFSDQESNQTEVDQSDVDLPEADQQETTQAEPTLSPVEESD